MARFDVAGLWFFSLRKQPPVPISHKSSDLSNPYQLWSQIFGEVRGLPFK